MVLPSEKAKGKLHEAEEGLRRGGNVTYVVKAGDNLRKIAKAELGDADRWSEIAELNKATLPDPDKINPGQKLILPPK